MQVIYEQNYTHLSATRTYIVMRHIPLLEKKRLNKKNLTNPIERNDRRATTARLFRELIKWFCNSRVVAALAYNDVFSVAIVTTFVTYLRFARAANRNLRRTRPARQLHAPQDTRARLRSPSRSRRISIVRRCSSISETHSRGKIIAFCEIASVARRARVSCQAGAFN